MTVSTGIASFPHDGGNSSGLVDAALQALYVAKQAGTNRTCAYRAINQL